MEIIVAKTAGFCFGVRRAVEKLEQLVDAEETEKPIYTYGPIIHNPQVVEAFEEKGVKIIEDLEFIKRMKAGTVLVRSHGISEDELLAMSSLPVSVCDCTCPYVSKIHKIVKRNSEAGYRIIIIGNKNHPEVKGIAGWADREVFYVENINDIDSLEFDDEERYSVVAQTTFDTELFAEIVNKLQKKLFHVIIDETVCQATRNRQTEARELSEKVTKMLVIGGKKSSNTRKLFEICKRQCKDTYYIETIKDLELNVFSVNDIIGITAGASTPKKIIEEVISNVRRNVEF